MYYPVIATTNHIILIFTIITHLNSLNYILQILFYTYSTVIISTIGTNVGLQFKCMFYKFFNLPIYIYNLTTNLTGQTIMAYKIDTCLVVAITGKYKKLIIIVKLYANC